MTLFTKRKIILWVTVLLLIATTSAFAELYGINFLKATGVDWLSYSNREKVFLLRQVYTYLKLDPKVCPIDDCILSLNVYYINIVSEADKKNEGYVIRRELRRKCVDVIKEEIIIWAK